MEQASGSRTQTKVEIPDFNETRRKKMNCNNDCMNSQKLSSQYQRNNGHDHRLRSFIRGHEHQSKKQQPYHNEIPSLLVKNKNIAALVNAAHQYAKATPTTATRNNRAKTTNNQKTKIANCKPKAKAMGNKKGTYTVDKTKGRIGTSAQVSNRKSSHHRSPQALKQQKPIQQLHEPSKRAAQNHAGTTIAAKASHVCQFPSLNTTKANGVRSHKNFTFKQQSPNKQKSTNKKQSPKRQESPKNQQSQSRVIGTEKHASLLLTDNSKILVQNGATKPACSTLYSKAFDQSSSPTRTASHHVLPSNPSNYVEVYRSTQDNSPSLADFCAVAHNINTCSESAAEEEYTGEPFYLPNETEKDTQQSHCIRYQPVQVSVFHMNSEENKGQAVYYKPESILTPSLFPNVPPYLNFSSHKNKGPCMPLALYRILKWKLSPGMPKIVQRIVLNSGFRIIKNTTDWMAVWERHMRSIGFKTVRSHQKYNHMPASLRIGRKDRIWQYICRKVETFGKKAFGFMQKSFILPQDIDSLRKAWQANAALGTKWIVKPPAGARGTGICIVNKWSQIPKDRPVVVQKYIEKPLLINENKFDMRVYVLVTSINPLRIYLFKDGLARFAAMKYSPELDHLGEKCMHLTNYSINKFSENYTKNVDFNLCQGHKWTLQSLWSYLEARKVNTKRLWATLRDLIIKAIISGESSLNYVYNQNVNSRYNCFELLGFDILLDENLVPWLLEINVSPSLHADLPLDLHVKGPLLQAVFNTTLYQVPPKLSEETQNEMSEELGLSGSICYDKRLFTTCLTTEEVRKHREYTSVTCRENYLDTILDHLLPDDIRCLIISEDEYARCNPLERIFPTIDTHKYLQYIDNPRYYNRLLDAWEHKHGHDRKKGISILRRLCETKKHLEVSEAANKKEPNVGLTDIDMLQTRKDYGYFANYPITSNGITSFQQSEKRNQL